MFNYIINFFTKGQPQTQHHNQPDNQNQPDIQKLPDNHLFNEQYRNAYNKLWIKKLQNYCP